MELNLLTIREVADLLKVSEVTVTRWLKQGRLPAYRVGPRAVRVRRTDVEHLLQPVESSSLVDERIGADHGTAHNGLTDAETEQGWEALRELDALAEQIATRRGGVPLSDSVEIIRGEREKRSRQLHQATRQR